MLTARIPPIVTIAADGGGPVPQTISLLTGPLHLFSTRRWVQRRPRRARLPWLRCLHCLRRLAQIDVHEGWTCVRVGTGWSVETVKLKCACGTVRKFVPRSIG